MSDYRWEKSKFARGINWSFKSFTFERLGVAAKLKFFMSLTDKHRDAAWPWIRHRTQFSLTLLWNVFWCVPLTSFWQSRRRGTRVQEDTRVIIDQVYFVPASPHVFSEYCELTGVKVLWNVVLNYFVYVKVSLAIIRSENRGSHARLRFLCWRRDVKSHKETQYFSSEAEQFTKLVVSKREILLWEPCFQQWLNERLPLNKISLSLHYLDLCRAGSHQASTRKRGKKENSIVWEQMKKTQENSYLEQSPLLHRLIHKAT